MNILLIILVAYAVVSPLFYAKALKFGMKLGNKPEQAVEEPIFNVPIPKKKPKMTAEEDRMYQILRNIDNYNGSSQGQVKVEVKNG